MMRGKVMPGVQPQSAYWDVGQHVQAYWPEGDRGPGYYPGEITELWQDGTADIRWDDDSGVNTVSLDDLKRPPGWVVGQRVQVRWDEDGYFYPAEIKATRPDGTVQVRWEDGTLAKVPLDHLKRRRGRPTSSEASRNQLKQADVINMPLGNKQEAFQRLAQQRTEKALKYIRLIQNLSDRHNYHYTVGQVAKIFEALRRALDKAESKFSDGMPHRSFEL